MKKFLITFAFFAMAFGGVTLSQVYPLVTIEEIQNASPSPYLGDTVRVQAMTMARTVVDPQNDRRPILWAGSRWQTYLYDPNGQTYQNYDGIVAIQHDTTGAAQGTFFDLVDSAQVIEVTGVINKFNQTTQFELLVDPVTPVQIISQEPQRTPPLELEMTEFMSGGALVPEGIQYESQYVILRNVISSDRNTGTGTFRINDGMGNHMFMYDQSGYFTLRGHRLVGITNYQPPVDGTVINFIRGLIQARNDGYYIIPIYPGDIDISFTPPAISEVRRSLGEVMTNQGVTISSNIIDLDGTVDSVKLYYRIDGGSFIPVDMNLTTGSIYSGPIPGVNSDSALVDYYIWAKDDQGNVSTVPTNPELPQYFYLVLNRNVTIQDVQYNPFGTDISGYNGYYVTLTGTVTADTSDFPGTGITAFQLYMQNGTGPWSGIRLGTRGNLSNEVSALTKGDNISFTGYVWDGSNTPTFNVTRIDSATDVSILTTGNPLPDFQTLNTNDIGLGGNGMADKEQWESVLIKYDDVLVTDENADDPSNFGEMLVDDGSGDTRVELEDGRHSYHNLSDPTRAIYVRTGDTFDALSGILYYSFGNYKLVPRNDGDFVGHVSDVELIEGVLPTEYSLTQNYPNPFNPSTTINYAIPQEANVSLKVYNLLGQEVMSLVNNQTQSVGTYKVTFDAGNLPSGIYLYRITAGNFVDVKKMMLLK